MDLQNIVNNKLHEQNKTAFLDGIRGVAVIMVVVSHLGKSKGMYDYATCAIHIFFVLSSFLLTMKMYESIKITNKKETNIATYSVFFAKYFTKRFMKIYPLYALLILTMKIFSEFNLSLFLKINKENLILWDFLTFSIPFHKIGQIFFGLYH